MKSNIFKIAPETTNEQKIDIGLNLIKNKKYLDAITPITNADYKRNTIMNDIQDLLRAYCEIHLLPQSLHKIREEIGSDNLVIIINFLNNLRFESEKNLDTFANLTNQHFSKLRIELTRKNPNSPMATFNEANKEIINQLYFDLERISAIIYSVFINDSKLEKEYLSKINLSDINSTNIQTKLFKIFDSYITNRIKLHRTQDSLETTKDNYSTSASALRQITATINTTKSSDDEILYALLKKTIFLNASFITNILITKITEKTIIAPRILQSIAKKIDLTAKNQRIINNLLKHYNLKMI